MTMHKSKVKTVWSWQIEHFLCSGAHNAVNFQAIWTGLGFFFPTSYNLMVYLVFPSKLCLFKFVFLLGHKVYTSIGLSFQVLSQKKSRHIFPFQPP